MKNKINNYEMMNPSNSPDLRNGYSKCEDVLQRAFVRMDPTADSNPFRLNVLLTLWASPENC